MGSSFYFNLLPFLVEATSGSWSAWSGWSPCTKHCTKTRMRICQFSDYDDRTPCVGDSVIKTHCHRKECERKYFRQVWWSAIFYITLLHIFSEMLITTQVVFCAKDDLGSRVADYAFGFRVSSMFKLFPSIL